MTASNMYYWQLMICNVFNISLYLESTVARNVPCALIRSIFVLLIIALQKLF